jgi:hypothetical protein
VLDDADLVSGEAIAAVALRPADADGTWWLVPGGAVADVVVGVDGDELVSVRSAPPMAGPLNHASAPLDDRSAREGERRVLGPAAAFGAVLDRWKVLTSAALVGISASGSLLWISSTTLLQTLTPDRLRGRIFALDYAGLTLSFSLAITLTGRASDGWGWSAHRIALAAAAAGAVVAVGWALVAPRMDRRPPGSASGS